MILRTVLLFGLVGCASPSASAPPPTPGPRPRDPAAYAGEPGFRGSTDGSTALRLSTGHEQATGLALAFVLDASRADESALASRLADRLARMRPRVGARIEPRAMIVGSLVRWVQTHGGPAPDRLEELVQPSRLTVEPLGRVLGREPIPEGLDATDLVVRVPFAIGGRVPLRGALPSWTEDLILLVRPGPEPVVIGL